jgi:hypothetical protein
VEYHQSGLAVFGQLGKLHYALDVSGKVSYCGIDLSQRDFHSIPAGLIITESSFESS